MKIDGNTKPLRRFLFSKNIFRIGLVEGFVININIGYLTYNVNYLIYSISYLIILPISIPYSWPYSWLLHIAYCFVLSVLSVGALYSLLGLCLVRQRRLCHQSGPYESSRRNSAAIRRIIAVGVYLNFLETMRISKNK